MKTKFVSIATAASLAALSITMPAAAQSAPTTVSVTGKYGIGVVTDQDTTLKLPNGNANYAANPAAFDRAELCVSNVGQGIYAFRPDGTIDPRRAANVVCAPIVDGRASLRGNFARGATPIVRFADGTFAWAARDTISGLPPIS